MTGKRDAQHATELELGGKARRSPNLRVLEPLELPSDWEMRKGVPATRADCASIPRPCPYVQCRYHLWLTEAESRPGRRWHDKGGAPKSELQATTMRSCALDIADTGEKLNYAEIGKLFGVSDERARMIFESARHKVAALGYTMEDLLGPEAR